MAEVWLVDGYNLLCAINGGRPPRTSQKNVSREDLFTALAGFAEPARPVLLVLDGKGDAAEFAAYCTGDLRIVYSGDRNADAFIERRIFEKEPGEVIRVVTRDRGIVQLARGRGALVQDPTAFWEAVRVNRKEKDGSLFGEAVRGHGFNRPFEEAMRRKGLIS